MHWLVKLYKEKFPFIDVESKSEISTEELEQIIILMESDICVGSDKFNELVNNVPRNFVGWYDFQMAIKKITNPSGKRGGSKRTIDYWINRGHSIDVAKQKISTIQKNNTKTSTEYWVNRGASLEEAVINVSDFQSTAAKRMHEVSKQNGTPISNSITKDLKNSEIQKRRATDYWNKLKADSFLSEERKTKHPLHVEYWTNKFGTDGVAKFEQYLRDKFVSRGFRSIIGDEFCLSLSENFKENKTYFGEKEFGKYIPNVGYRKYDYVDTTLKICVEFNGVYWHDEQESEREKQKREYIESLGYKYFVVWEDEYKTNKQTTIEKITKEIQECVQSQK